MARNKGIPGSKRDKKRKKQQKKVKKPLAVGRILIEMKKPLAVGRILIVCEGEKTEPNYFKWWQDQLKKIREVAKSKAVGDIDVKIEVKGEGRNTMSLVEKAIEIRDRESIDYTQAWCVFDYDSFRENYNPAIEKARANDFKVAYSNEAFELWYWLHFDYINTGVSRRQYKEKLTKRLGEQYEKNDPAMYEKLLNHPEADQQQAIKNARNLNLLYKDKDSKKYADHNPSTTVFELVESLNEHVWRFRCQLAPAYSLPYPHDCRDCKESTKPPPPYSCLLRNGKRV